MLAEERRSRMMTLLYQEGKVYVKSLSKELGVTTETIRKDLDYLSTRSKLIKVHGGAVRVEDVKSFDPVRYYEKREKKMYREKQRIGREAAALVEDGDVIALDVGTTTIRVVEFLKEKRDLTILINSVTTLMEVVRLPEDVTRSWKIFFLGGEVNRNLMSVSGGLANQFVDNFYVEKFFMACDGLDKSITSNNCNEAMLASKMIKNSRRVILLADSSKIGRRYFNKICDIEEADTIISDGSIGELKSRSEKNIEVIEV